MDSRDVSYNTDEFHGGLDFSLDEGLDDDTLNALFGLDKNSTHEEDFAVATEEQPDRKRAREESKPGRTFPTKFDAVINHRQARNEGSQMFRWSCRSEAHSLEIHHINDPMVGLSTVKELFQKHLQQADGYDNTGGRFLVRRTRKDAQTGEAAEEFFEEATWEEIRSYIRRYRKQLDPRKQSTEEELSQVVSSFSKITLDVLSHPDLHNVSYFDPRIDLGDGQTARDRAMVLLKENTNDDVSELEKARCAMEITFLEYPGLFRAPFHASWNASVECFDKELGGEKLALERARWVVQHDKTSACQAIEVVLFGFPKQFGLTPPEGWDRDALICGDTTAHRHGKRLIFSSKGVTALQCMQKLMAEYPNSFSVETSSARSIPIRSV